MASMPGIDDISTRAKSLTREYYIEGKCCNKNCLKGRGGNDVQHKKLKKKIHCIK